MPGDTFDHLERVTGPHGAPAFPQSPSDGQIGQRPNRARVYRQQVAALREAITDEDRSEAAEIIRTLIERTELAPAVQDGRKSPPSATALAYVQEPHMLAALMG